MKGIHGTYRMDIGAGNLIIEEGKSSLVEADLGSGRLKAKGAFAAFDLDGAGSIDLENEMAPLGNASASVGVGSITYKSQRALKTGESKFSVGTGSIAMKLADQSQFKVKLSKGIGNFENEFDKKFNDKHVITADTGIGNIEIKKIPTIVAKTAVAKSKIKATFVLPKTKTQAG